MGGLIYSLAYLGKMPDKPVGAEPISEEIKLGWRRKLDKMICLLFAFHGLLFLVLGVPLIMRRVGPNSFYGFRTAKSMSTPEIWYAANEVSGWDLSIAGAVICVASLALFFARERLGKPGRAWLLAFGVFIVALTAAVVHSVIVVNGM